MSRVSPQLIVFSYHKSGTSLFLHVMTKVCEKLGLTLANHYGLVNRLDVEPDVVLLPHSVLRAPLDRPYRAIRLIRDPRDIWVSGYLYHLRCDEEWCRNNDLHPTPAIRWPQVDYSVEHWPEDWKRHYLKRLGGKSYQQNLLDRSLEDGLDFELETYTGCTLTAMREWGLNKADALDVKLEDVMADFDGAMKRILDHFGFNPDQAQAALEVARSEDVRRMDDAALVERPQIHSREISKWQSLLSAVQIARFEGRHGDLIRELRYEPANGIPDGPEDKEQNAAPWAFGALARDFMKTTPDAGIRLLADSTPIRPAATGEGMYTFIVPPGRRRVRLESRCSVAADQRLSTQSDGRRLGVRVSGMAIRSDAGEMVIAPDDPNLTVGWHDAEHVGKELCRWTDGSAELPWTGVCGPAIVTLRCGTLCEYPIDDGERPL
jgi:hypothetical protein